MKFDITIKGMITTETLLGFDKVRIQYTEDETGKTLSVGNDKMQFTVPFEEIEKEIKKIRSKKW